jgi:PAS domain S-box-containing protein
MGALMRAHPWAATDVGTPDTWPQALRTTVRLLLTSHHPMFIFWGDSHICFYNDAYRATMGPEQHPRALGRPARQVWDQDWDDVWSLVEPQLEQVMSGGEATWHENQSISVIRNGRRENVYWTYGYSPIDDPTAPCGIGGVLALGREVTADVLAKRAQADDAERLRQLFEQSPTFIAVLRGPTLVYELVNAAMQLRLGRVVIGRTVREAFPELEEQGFLAILEKVYATGETYTAHGAPITYPAGSIIAGQQRYIDFVYQPLRDASGAVTGIFVAGNDVTEAKWTEHALRASEARFEAITDSIDQLIWSVNADGSPDYFNRRWYDYTDLPDRPLDAETLVETIHPEDRAHAKEIWNHCLATGEPFRDELRLRHHSGQYRWMLARAQPVRDDAGRITRWFGTCTDIDAIVAAREILARSRAEMGRLVAERTSELMLSEEKLRQSQKMEAVGQLTGGLAHDFNNLLTTVLGSLEMLQVRVAQGRTGDLTRHLEMAQKASKRAASLTQRLLAFSRRQNLDPKPTDVNRLVHGMTDLIHRTVGPAITVEVVAANELWSTIVDPAQLENALLNLCINARDAMPDGGRLTIETANMRLDGSAAQDRDLPTGNYVCLRVRDNGVGMSPEVAARAFDPFFTTKPLGMGTGLGLSMTYGFVRQSGGQVRIASTLGQGTTMCLYLPRHLGALEQLGAIAEPPVTPRVGRGETVLVVDDEPMIVTLVAEVLEELGYCAIQASDGASGLRVLQSDARIDLLVTDVGLPGGMNGRQMADAARIARPDLKVLFITGYAENAALGDGKLPAGMYVLPKPFTMEVLAARIEKLIPSL